MRTEQIDEKAPVIGLSDSFPDTENDNGFHASGEVADWLSGATHSDPVVINGCEVREYCPASVRVVF